MTVKEALEWADKSDPFYGNRSTCVQVLAAEVRRLQNKLDEHLKRAEAAEDEVRELQGMLELAENTVRQWQKTSIATEKRAEAAEIERDFFRKEVYEKFTKYQNVVDAARDLCTLPIISPVGRAVEFRKNCINALSALDKEKTP